MASFNRVILVGNLTRDVEIRYIPSGTAVTDISIAVNERVKRNNEWVEETNFFDITLWGRTAEIASEYLSKGSSILIEGRLKLDRWEQDGQKRSKVKIIGEKMQMLNRTGGSGGSGGGHDSGSANYQNQNYQSQPGNSNGPHTNHASQHSSAPAAQGPPPEDDIPF